MKSFTEYLEESFNTKPLPFKQTRDFSDYKAYEFKIEERKYVVSMAAKRDNVWDVIFTLDIGQGFGSTSSLGMTGTGDQFVVINTVIATIKDFVQKNFKNINVIKMTAEKKTGSSELDKTRSDSRAKVYKRLIKREMKNFPGNWRFSEIGAGSQQILTVRNLEFEI